MAKRGEIVVVDFAVAGMAKKVRPVLVIQADVYNSKMTNTVVAMISTNLMRAAEPTHLLIDVTTEPGRQSGLLHTSVVNCNTLTTVRQTEILRTLGSLPPDMMLQIDDCLKIVLQIA